MTHLNRIVFVFSYAFVFALVVPLRSRDHDFNSNDVNDDGDCDDVTSVSDIFSCIVVLKSVFVLCLMRFCISLNHWIKIRLTLC